MALRERVASLTADYEDKIADLRVDLTIALDQLKQFKESEDAPVAVSEPADPTA